MERSALEFILHETWTAMRRNPLITVASIGNLTIALLVLGAFALGAINLDYMAGMQAKSTVVHVYLEPDADWGAIENTLYGDPRVKDTEFVSAEANLQKWAKMNGIDPDALKIINNPLPAEVLVTVVDPDDIAAVADAAGALDGVEEVEYSRAVTEQIVRLSNGIKTSGLLIGILLVGGTMLVVSTTIRLTIYARRREIRIMQLVGATNGFIRAPLLLEGAFQGVAGGFVSALFLVIAYVYVHAYLAQNLQFLKLVYSSQFIVAYGLGLVLAGTVFGVCGALISTNRYLAEA